ncbi:MAG: hypothetical protein GY754_13520 [bacterium]|nr:hypothetical protein [bacterium]
MNIQYKHLIIFLALFLFISFNGACKKKAEQWPFPNIEPVYPKAYSSFDFDGISESSGLVKSRKWENVYWTLNDSGNQAKIYPVTREGKLIKPQTHSSSEGIVVKNAENTDWEDIAADDKGNLIIGDFGNNKNTRRDLVLYIVKEPDPYTTVEVEAAQKIPFYFPDQEGYPPQKKNFDLEALFVANGRFYVLTKHRSDINTKLYRFDSLDSSKKNPLTLLGTYAIQGRVTGADTSPDGNMLTVLTYYGIWLFEAKQGTDFFKGEFSWLPMVAGQCEGICFDGDTIVISNEEKMLFEVNPDKIRNSKALPAAFSMKVLP